MSTVKILSILEAASIEPPKARAIAESLEMAFREQEEDLTKRLMTKQDGADLRTELSTKTAESKAKIILWMFILWIAQFISGFAVIKFL
jgi:hypothetical protein